LFGSNAVPEEALLLHVFLIRVRSLPHPFQNLDPIPRRIAAHPELHIDWYFITFWRSDYKKKGFVCQG